MISKTDKTGTINFSLGEVIFIDKPKNISSFGVIRKLKRIVKIKKIGHAGTLDPLATGLLIMCTGKFTKRINEYQGMKKTYTGKFTLGASTPSFDSETEKIKEFDISEITEEQILKTRTQFLGKIEQQPPVYSALKINGERLYKKARRGENPEIKKRIVEIFKFEIKDINLPEITFLVECSKGTYIRSIANDFGKALNNGAYLSELRRTKIGDYDVADALTIDEFEKLIKESNIESL
ncbi:MAG: tRNA pseudouridine(55) synthase TruB [Bacteroidota bacterium]|nr:tRNA pseudouridine(55) synthase TruB [Bacteroidota bacterium]